MKTHLKQRLLSLGFALACVASPALKAQLSFHVDLNTAALTSALNSPFYLDFQLNEGSGSVSNAITLSNFTFTGGNAVGSANLFGTVTGSLISNVLLTDSPASPFNEFFQRFSVGTTSIHFDATVSQHVAGATPDGFFASILDSETGFPQIGTTAPDGVSLVALNLGPTNTLSSVGAFSSISPVGVSASVSALPSLVAVPESSSYAVAATLMLAGVAAVRRRKQVTSLFA